MGGAGVDGDAVGRIEGPAERVAVEHAHLRPGPQVAAGAGGERGVDLEGGDAAAAPHLLRQDGGEVARAGADMHHVLARARGEGGHQPGVVSQDRTYHVSAPLDFRSLCSYIVPIVDGARSTGSMLDIVDQKSPAASPGSAEISPLSPAEGRSPR